jgi:hypothetical protein
MDRGFVTSNDPKTGDEIYGRQRIAVDAGTFSASPWAYNGKLFATSEDGDTFVLQAGREFKVLGRNSLGEMTLASPAVANGSVIIRTRRSSIGSRGRRARELLLQRRMHVVRGEHAREIRTDAEIRQVIRDVVEAVGHARRHDHDVAGRDGPPIAALEHAAAARSHRQPHELCLRRKGAIVFDRGSRSRACRCRR